MATEVHPLAELVPAMTEREFAELCEDIAANGLEYPITLYEGKVLDGRHRDRACETVGVEPRYEQYAGDTPAKFVISHNLRRRHLSESQRAMVAMDFLPHLEAEARKRQERGLRRGTSPAVAELAPSAPNGDNGKTRATEEAGELVGTSARLVQRAKRVQEADPDEADRVRRGEVSVDAAERHLIQAGAIKQRKPPTVNAERGDRPRTQSGPVDVVENVVGKCANLVAALDHIDASEVIDHAQERVAQWDKDITKVMKTLGAFRRQMRETHG